MLAVTVLWRGQPLLVEWDKIRRLEFACRPRKFCTPTTSCCANYEVVVSRRERRIIDGMLPFVSAYLPHIRVRGGFANLFDQIEPGLYAIEQDDQDTCRFAYRAGGTLLCSLHRAALDLGIDPARVKPRACALWPLSLLHRSGKLVLSVDSSAKSFTCVRFLSRPRSKPCPSVRHIICTMFGNRLINDLLALQAAAKRI